MILKPLITEKSTHLSSKGQYCFEVAKDANKTEIGKAIASFYNVKVDEVKTQNRRGKIKRHRRIAGRRKNTKKAIVILEKGEKIADFEIKADEPEKTKEKA